ncbi:unnamed protein product [Mytilus coruscus]|uniref:Uncharacterized protein n=1 Tax=Mytilus coruscus TaxID=42192 RepID=A0A6J8C1B1_MYTCO|nr:unnamed protein product [Mytilus coruscus]
MLVLYLLTTSLTYALPWKDAKLDRRNDIRSLLDDVYRIKERERYNAEGETENKKILSELEDKDLRRMTEVLQRVKSNPEEKQIEKITLKLQPVPENKRSLLRERKRHLKLVNQRRKPKKNKGRKSEKYYLENPKIYINESNFHICDRNNNHVIKCAILS